jgi:sugar (pentulose or hexulose) kinase
MSIFEQLLSNLFTNEQNERVSVASVGIDLGTTNTKVALVTVDAADVRVRALATAPTPEPNDLKAVLIALVREVLADHPPPDAIGIASMAETGVPLDAAGTPLGPWLRWTGHRAGPEADALAERLGWVNLVAATGVRPSAKVPLATWAWLRTHRPDTWRAMARWAGVADLAAYLLTGRLTTDHTLAGRTMAYRLAGGPPATFDPDLLAEVGLRPDHLPAVTSSPAGVTDPDFVHCGIRAGTPVAVAGHDHAVGSYACGVREPGDVTDSLGTAEAVMTVVAGAPDPLPVGRAGMSTVVTVGGRHRAILAGSSSAGATVEWWREHGSVVLDGLPAGPTGVLVLPYLRGRQTPAPDPAARLRVIGRSPAHGPAVLTKAMLEGLCLHTRWMLDEQARLATPGETVFLFGGAVAANPAWTRIKAEVLPARLRVVRAEEPVAAGAALVAAVRAGCVDPPGPALASEAAPAAPAGTYDDMYARFVAAAREHS